jgi:hypothetical protein
VKPVGEWNLFVFCCHWRVVTAGEVLADDDSLPAQIEAAAQAMDGQRLTAFELDAASHQAVLSFDLGARLTTWPYASDDEEQSSLYLPDERVLTYRADGFASIGPPTRNRSRRSGGLLRGAAVSPSADVTAAAGAGG